MRKCLRCDEVMIEDYTLKVQNITAQATLLLAKENGFFHQRIWGK